MNTLLKLQLVTNQIYLHLNRRLSHKKRSILNQPFTYLHILKKSICITQSTLYRLLNKKQKLHFNTTSINRCPCLTNATYLKQ